MKNFKNYYDRVAGMANSKLAKPKKEATTGLLSKPIDKITTTDTSSDAFSKVSNYIAAIKKQKEELMRGK